MLNEKDIFKNILNKNIIELKNFDDAAIVDCGNGKLIISTDFIRGPHFNIFEAGYLSFYDLAHYLIAANASDVASMGVTPSGFLNIFRYPLSTSKEIQESFFDGINDASKFYNLKTVGGDSGSYAEYVLGGTCFGFTSEENFLRRNNAKDGDLIYVTSGVGMCRAAQIGLLEIGEENFSANEIDDLLMSWKKPLPPLTLGPWLAKNNVSICAQDTSDGLGETIKNICDMSNVGATIHPDKIPINELMQKVALKANRDVLDISLSTSPDFQLLFTANGMFSKEIEESEFSDIVHCIGSIKSDQNINIHLSNKKISFDDWNQSNNFKV